MSKGSDQEKTEQPTPKRLQEARKKGQVAQSKEVSSALILLSSLGVFLFGGSWMFWSLSGFMRGIFQNLGTFRLHDVSTVSAFLLEIFEQYFLILMPLMLVVFVAGIAANIFQIGFLFTPKPLIPDLSKLDPVKGMKKFFSLKALAELVKSLFKIFSVGGIAFLMLKGELETIPSLIQMSIAEILSFIGRVSFNMCLYVCLFLIVLAILDYVYQRWQHEKDMKMTKQEVKDESKQTEGDPTVKSRIRKAQMEIAQRRMMEAVPDADVVVTNPTSLAIALKFDAKEMIAPQVMAKGAGFIAERIKEIAKENQVPVVEQKQLAQALFKLAEVGDSVPVDLYRAVAEILAYVYRLKGMGV
ncbi:MAG: flagellar biosynthesis protein FlhB [Deltaproteobacteria bacterium]|nr:flagellar biosynthesis protein FlhB [Deltaproteobacteria bacterium]